MAKRGLDVKLLDNIIFKISHGEELDRKYKDHILKGKFRGFHECHIQPDWLLIYKIQDDMLILTLIDTGSHADLFDMWSDPYHTARQTNFTLKDEDCFG